MEENIRKDEIKERFLYNDITDELLDYSVQEIIFLYSQVIEELKKSDCDTENMERRKNIVFRAILFRIMRSEKIYMAFHVVTGYPYADVKGCSWIFSQKEYAEDAVSHYLKLGIPLTVKEFSGQEEIFDGLFELRRLGIENIAVDNGRLSTIIRRSDILRENEMNLNDEYDNPGIMAALISLSELGYASNGKHESIPEMETALFKLIAGAKLLVPAKTREHVADGGKTEIKDTTKVDIALINNEKTNTKFVPAFTDWKEFIKLYSKDEWNAVLLSYDEIRRACEKLTGFILNPSGFSLPVTHEVLKKIDELAK